MNTQIIECTEDGDPSSKRCKCMDCKISMVRDYNYYKPNGMKAMTLADIEDDEE